MKKTTLNIPQTATIMAILIMGSKLLGFLRELILANAYGAGVITDAYVMAISIPNTLLAGIISAATVAYMPIFANKVELQGEEEGNRFTSQLYNFLLLLSVIAAFIGILFSHQLVSLFAPGYRLESANLTAFYLKISFFAVFFHSSISLFETFLQYKGVFLPQIALGYAQSFSVIIVTIISTFTTHYLLAFGIVLGYGIRGIGSLILAQKHSYRYISDWHLTAAVKESMILALPVFIGGSVNQLNVFIDRILASSLQTGSVSALNYGSMIINVISMFSVTIFVTIIYPKLNQAFARKEYGRINEMAEKGVGLIALIAIPFTLGAMCYSEIAVQVVYERGAFDESATSLTAIAFFYYAIGLTFIALNSLITKIFYSMHDTKTAVYCSVAAIGLNIVLNLILVQYMAHAGLALATSISQALNTLLLYYTAKYKYPEIHLMRSKRKILKIIIFSLVSIGLSYVFFIVVGNNIWMPRMVLLGFSVTIAMLIYLYFLWKAQFEEIDLIRDIFRLKTMKH